MIRHIILSYALLATAASYSAHIAGQVLDGAGGTALGYVDVSITPLSQTLRTGPDGSFNINDLPAGKYKITITQEGRLPESVVVEVSSDKAASVEIPLHRAEPADKPADRTKNWDWMPVEQWKDMHAKDCDRAAEGNLDLVFLGDSITEQWETTGATVWNEWLNPAHTANFGIGGDTTQNLLWRIENNPDFQKSTPEVVVVLIGTNNFGISKHRPDEVSDGITAIVSRLRQLFAETEIILLPVFPRSAAPDAPVRSLIRETNQAITHLNTLDRVSVIDLESLFLNPDGSTNAGIYTPDNLHLSANGYSALSRALTPLLRQRLTPEAAQRVFKQKNDARPALQTGGHTGT